MKLDSGLGSISKSTNYLNQRLKLADDLERRAILYKRNFEDKFCMIKTLEEIRDVDVLLTSHSFSLGKIVAAKPDNETGNFSVVTGPNKTRVKKDGSLESLPQNVMAPDYRFGDCPVIYLDANDKLIRSIDNLVLYQDAITILLKINSGSGADLDTQARLIIKDLAGVEVPLKGSGNIAITVYSNRIKFHFPDNGQPLTELEFDRSDNFESWEIYSKIGGVGIELIAISNGIEMDFSWWLKGDVSSHYLETNWSLVTVLQDRFGSKNLEYFPKIDTSLITSFQLVWTGNNLISFPLIDTSSGTNFKQAWYSNKLTSFPLINTKRGVNFKGAWFYNNLISFPLIDTSSGTNFRQAWAQNKLTSFPLINTKRGVDFYQAWFYNNLTSFPLIDTSSGTNFRQAWQLNSLTTWLPNFFDNCPATNFQYCWRSNDLDEQGVDNILESINNARLSGIQVTGDVKVIGISRGTNATPSLGTQKTVDLLRSLRWNVTLNGYDPADLDIYISKTTHNQNNYVELTGHDLLAEFTPTNNFGAYYLLEKNSSDSFGNFVSGTLEGGFDFDKINEKSLLKLDGISGRFVANTYTAEGITGAAGDDDYTAGLWLHIPSLPAADKWVWSGYDAFGVKGTGLKLRTDGKLEFHRGSDVLVSVTAITADEITGVYCRYTFSTGAMEIFIKGVLDATGTSTSIQDIALVDDLPIYIGYHHATTEYTALNAGKFRLSNVALADSEILGLSEVIKFDIKAVDQTNSANILTIGSEWVLEYSNDFVNFTVPEDFPFGDYRIYLESNTGLISNKFEFKVVPITMEAAFTETFDNAIDFENRWQAINRAWGGDNGGVVAENVYIDSHLGENVLVLEAHGDNYTGTVQGVDRYGEPKFNPDGTPWTKRVGGVAVGKNYVGFGSFEYEAKVVPKLGVASAFWNFHYQEVYPSDPRWDRYTGDYVRENLPQVGLKSQFNTLQHQNANTAGTDASTSFITDGANTTYELGVKGEPNTIGEVLRYQGSTGYAIDFLNTSIITDPLNTEWAINFWVRVGFEAANNARHNIITQGNYANSFGVQAYYQTNYYELQAGIRTDTGSSIIFGPAVQVEYGKMYHVTFGVKNGELHHYINGELAATMALPAGTFTAQNWWRAIQSTAFAGGGAGYVPKDMALSDVRIFKDYFPSLLELRTHYGRPYFVGALDYSYLNLSIAGSESQGFYVVRNNEIDIEVPSHLKPDGIIDEPSLANAKFNSWRGEWQNWGTPVENYQYWEEYRDNYRPMGIDVTDGLYHKYRYDWYPDRVEFFIDDVKIITNTNFQFGIDSLNIPETAGKMTLGPWFPSGSTLWAGKNANFDVEKMYVRKITYTPFQNEIDNKLLKLGETYPESSVGGISIKYDNL